MTETGRTGTWIGKTLNDNLWAILCAVSTGAGGVLIGMTTANHRLDELERDMAQMADRVGPIESRQQRVVRNLDRINDKLGIVPPQPLEVNE